MIEGDRTASMARVTDVVHDSGVTGTWLPPANHAPKAGAVASRAAERSGVRVMELTDMAAIEAVYRLFDGIWRPDPANPPVTTEMLRALTKAGNYLAGAYEGDLLVGACVGFFAAPRGSTVHSHVAGVATSARRRSIGFALKLHQRAWALARGVHRITWTFDPLVQRNAYFNLGKLGATPTEYLPNFYGPMADSINGGDETDRVLMTWDLVAAATASACADRPALVDVDALCSAGAVAALSVGASGEPLVAADALHSPMALVAVPPDIEQLRVADRELAWRWRRALREVLGGALDGGARVVGFAREGWYVIDRHAADAAGAYRAGGLPGETDGC